MSANGGRPIRVSIVNDFEIVVRGLEAMLAPFSDRVTVVEVEAGGLPSEPTDVALFDTFAGRRRSLSRVDELAADYDIGKVVLYTWDVPDAFLRDIDNLSEQGARRTDVPVGVAYGTDLQVAHRALAKAVEGVDEVHDHPSPEVLLVGFGESSIDFVVRYWHAPTIAAFWKARSDVTFAVEEALATEGITIPFPQRTLWWGGRDEHGPDLVAMAEHAGLGLGQPEDDATVDDEG